MKVKNAFAWYVFGLLLSSGSSIAAPTLRVDDLSRNHPSSMPIWFRVNGDRANAYLFWVSVESQGQSGAWSTIYSSVASLRDEASEPALSYLRTGEQLRLFWLPNIDE